MNVSPKVWLPTVTGDKTALIVSLTGLVGGGLGALAPPAPGVTQRQVARLPQRRPKAGLSA